MEYLLVDGYNIIFAWDELEQLAAESLANARQRLCDILCDYQGITGKDVTVVFDAHLAEGSRGSEEGYHNITVVYTKEAETADNYIEHMAYKLSKKKSNKPVRITVATSDSLEQVIVSSRGANRMSAGDLLEDIKQVKAKIKEQYLDAKPIKNNPLASLLDEETAKKLDNMRYY